MMRRTMLGALMAAAVVSGALAQGASRAKDSKREGAQKAYFERLRAESPALAEAEERLFLLRKRQQNVVELYGKKKVGRDEAKAELAPLLAEEKRITDDPDYRAELLLSQAAAAKERRKETDAVWRTHLRMQEELQKRLRAPAVR